MSASEPPFFPQPTQHPIPSLSSWSRGHAVALRAFRSIVLCGVQTPLHRCTACCGLYFSEPTKFFHFLPCPLVKQAAAPTSTHLGCWSSHGASSLHTSPIWRLISLQGLSSLQQHSDSTSVSEHLQTSHPSYWGMGPQINPQW